MFSEWKKYFLIYVTKVKEKLHINKISQEKYLLDVSYKNVNNKTSLPFMR